MLLKSPLLPLFALAVQHVGGGGGREEERGGKNALRDEKAAVKEARDLLEQVQTAFR